MCAWTYIITCVRVHVGCEPSFLSLWMSEGTQKERQEALPEEVPQSRPGISRVNLCLSFSSPKYKWREGVGGLSSDQKHYMRASVPQWDDHDDLVWLRGISCSGICVLAIFAQICMAQMAEATTNNGTGGVSATTNGNNTTSLSSLDPEESLELKMTNLIDCVENAIWHAFDYLALEGDGTAPKSKLKVRQVQPKPGIFLRGVGRLGNVHLSLVSVASSYANEFPFIFIAFLKY